MSHTYYKHVASGRIYRVTNRGKVKVDAACWNFCVIYEEHVRGTDTYVRTDADFAAAFVPATLSEVVLETLRQRPGLLLEDLDILIHASPVEIREVCRSLRDDGKVVVEGYKFRVANEG